MSTDRRWARPDPPTHAEALAGAEQDLVAARGRFATASQRLSRARRYGRDPSAPLLAWNLARNEVAHREHQVEWWAKLLAAHPERASTPILPVIASRESDADATSPSPGPATAAVTNMPHAGVRASGQGDEVSGRATHGAGLNGATA